MMIGEGAFEVARVVLVARAHGLASMSKPGARWSDLTGKVVIQKINQSALFKERRLQVIEVGEACDTRAFLHS